MELTFFIEKGAIILGVFAVTMLIALYSTFGERIVAAYFQDRLGPNRAGPGGLLQPLADGLKCLPKRILFPTRQIKPYLFLARLCL
jgi:NADH-quinone oxidoreductase subunit H